MHRSVTRLLVTAGLLGALAVTAGAAGKNLKYYPEDIPDADLKAEMKILKRSLGTSCDLCHKVEADDFAAETKRKKIAREMLEMTKAINEKLFSKDGVRGDDGDRLPKATCYMCHKGEEKPQLSPKTPELEKRFDDKIARGKKKRVVEGMKRLVEALNKDYFTWKDAPKATCWMCHRGHGEFKTKLPAEDGATKAGDGEKRSGSDDEGKRERKHDDDERKHGDRERHEREHDDDDD